MSARSCRAPSGGPSVSALSCTADGCAWPAGRAAPTASWRTSVLPRRYRRAGLRLCRVHDPIDPAASHPEGPLHLEEIGTDHVTLLAGESVGDPGDATQQLIEAG